jgi:enoyl-CoA hydratase
VSGELVLTDREERVLTLRLNRPDKRNALSPQLVQRLGELIDAGDRDPDVHAIILTGEGPHFCAGADIQDLIDGTTEGFILNDRIDEGRERVAKARKPVIAAVSGYALGGGFELALMCDILLSDSSARFGLPEVKLGTLPGAGGTQRLTRAVGKCRASELILTGRIFDSAEAARLGIAIECEDVQAQARHLATAIGANSAPAVHLAKEAIGRAFESSLQEALQYERRLFHASLSFPHLKEAATAFAAAKGRRNSSD